MVEDNKYKRGKIYRIYCEDECYIGSTIEPYISNRLSGHKKAYKYFLNGKHRKVTSFLLFEKYGIDNCKIELIESYPCEDINQLTAREGYYIRNTKGCVNKYIMGRTTEEYYEDNKEKIKEYRDQYKEKIIIYNKEYYEDNKDKLKKYKKEWYEKNKEQIKIQQKEYKDQHKEEKKEYQKEYRDQHKEKINEMKRIQCTCGLMIDKYNKSHVNTKKHLELVNGNK